jgi:tRNA pseudouridine55 synthase
VDGASLSGVLVVDKPAGPTSFEVVARVRRALKARKAGHAGTLDPAATGVLVVCLGDAVRLQQFLTDGEKGYEATVAFGAATDTQDAEGKVVAEGDPSGLTEEGVRSGLARFLGEISQVPPMYSAVRVGGRRLHEAARAGEEVDRSPRQVRITTLELLDLEPPGAARRLGRLSVRCSKGTYVRTLAADLGASLGVPAHLAALRRTSSSGFTLGQATPLEQLEAMAGQGGPEALRDRLVSPALALGTMPEARLELAEAVALAHGKSLPADPQLGGKVRAVDAHGRLVAVCEAAGGRLRPVRVFFTAAELSSPVTALNH